MEVASLDRSGHINVQLHERLLQASELVDQRGAHDQTEQDGAMRTLRRGMLALPALIGLLLHAPWYVPLRAITARKNRGTVFFDPVLFGLLFFTYPVWLLFLLALAATAGLGWWSLAVLGVAPLSLLALRWFSLR